MFIRQQIRDDESMIRASRISLLGFCIRRCAMAFAPLALAACDPQTSGSKEIFIEAVSIDVSKPFAPLPSGDIKSGTSPQAVQLHFDDSGYHVTPTSSLLYRGDYLNYVREQGHLGPGSLLVANRTASWQGPLVVLPTLEKRRAYKATVWVKMLDTEEVATVKLMWTQVADGTVTNLILSELQAEPRVWVKLEGEFVGNAQPGSVINTLSLDVEKVDVKYLVDDFMVAYAELAAELEAAAEAAKVRVTSLILNGGVEQGLEPWSHQGGIISRSAAHAHTGTYSLMISGRTQGWHAPVMPVRGLQDNKLYRFSLFSRMNEGVPATHVKLTLKRTTAGQTTFVPLGMGVVTNSNWTEISGTFSSENISDSEQVSVYLEAELPTASYFVDTLTVEEISED